MCLLFSHSCCQPSSLDNLAGNDLVGYTGNTSPLSWQIFYCFMTVFSPADAADFPYMATAPVKGGGSACPEPTL